MPELDTRFLTVAELARRWKQSEDTIRRKIAAGDIPAVRLGEYGPLRVPADALEEHLRPASGPRRTGVAATADDAATARTTRAGTREAA